MATQKKGIYFFKYTHNPNKGTNIGKKYDVKQKSVINTTRVNGKKSNDVLILVIIFKSIGVTVDKFDIKNPEYKANINNKAINAIKNFDFIISLIKNLSHKHV